MNKITSEKTIGLIIVAVVMWFALFLVFFMRPEAISRFVLHQRESQISSLILILGYLTICVVYLVKTTSRAKEIAPVFFHSQALVSLFPVTFIGTSLSLLSYAWLCLGHLPSPNHPDPETLGLSIPLLFLIWALSLLLCMTAYVCLYARGVITWGNKRLRIIGVLCSIVVWIAFFLVRFTDPLYFFDWLGD